MNDILIGFIDYTKTVFIPDPASTDGSGKTGLVAANLTVSYTRVEIDNDVTVTDVTSSLNNLASLTAAHNDWGVLEVSSTLAPGLYRLDIADAVFASGAWTAVVYVMITTSAAAASPIEFNLVAYNPLDGVRLGLTALPNAAAEAAGGLYTCGTGAGQIKQTNNGEIDANATHINNVATTSVTTINANVGTTQPENFTGTGASALVKVDMVDIAGAAVSTSTAQLGVNVVNNAGSAITSAAGVQEVKVQSIAANAVTAAAIADAAIDRATFAADTGLQTIRSNTAQSATGTTIVLDAGASVVDSFYNNDIIFITGGTGVGQARFVTAYVGATKTATVATWVTTPDNTSTFAILPFDVVAGASAPTAAQVATAVWQDTTAGDFTTAGSIGKSLFTSGAVPGAAGGVFIAGSNAATTVNITGNLTGNVSGSVGSVAASGIAASSFAAGAVDAAALATDAVNEIADGLLNRDMSTGTDSGSATVRTTRQALRAIRNKTTFAAGTLTVTKEDDATASWTAAVSTDAAALPIVGIDPAGP